MTMIQQSRHAIEPGDVTEGTVVALSAPVRKPVPDRLRSTPAPYATQCELIDARLDVTRARLRFATEHLAAITRDQHAKLVWPTELVMHEREIDLRVAATAEAGLSFPLMRLAQCFGIDAAALRVLWVLVAHELCPVARYLVRGLASEAVSDPTTDVLRRAVFGEARGRESWRAFEPDGVLRRFGLIERTDSADEAPGHRHTWRASPRVLALANDELGLDPSLAPLATLEAPAIPATELELTAGTLDSTRAAVTAERLVIVHGKSGTGRRSLLAAIAAERNLRCLVVDARAIAKEIGPARLQFRNLAREAKLLDVTPLIIHLDALEPADDADDRLELVECELEGRVLATANRLIARRWKRSPVMVEVGAIAGSQRVKLWQRAFPMATVGDTELLATLYPLAPAVIAAVGAAAIAHAGDREMTEEFVQAGLRTVLDDRFAGLATRMKVTQTWKDVVLPPDQGIAINELIARIRQRRVVHEDWGFADKVGKGLGVAALFSGAPGTGKTMVAGLVARSLRIEAYQVDLSKIVSKWIGETEKNLAALFDAAEAGHALLLFDEADALFGKRSDVKSSNDRHANQEINFLLQRLESFTGICILTTNHEASIDEAFRRRLAVHVRFEVPDVDERQRLWQTMIPANAPRTVDLPFEELAESYVMSGGYIRNAVLRAAFLAADEGGPIDARRLTRAAQFEYEAMGKIAPSKK